MTAGRPGLVMKVTLAGRALYWFVAVQVLLRRHDLPDVVARLGRAAASRPPLPPRRLGRGLVRILRLGSLRPRCLINALVFYRLLKEQGEPAKLILGLPARPTNTDAHAWVEIDGVDVGPPPGRGRHRELARFG
jgi:hypothetical protein